MNHVLILNRWNYLDFRGDQILHRHSRYWDRNKDKKTRRHSHLNKPSVENIADWLGLGKDFAYWCKESPISFRDLYIRFGHASFYSTYNWELKVSYRKWNKIRHLAFAVALFGTMVFRHGPSISINTRVITITHTIQRVREKRNNKILPYSSGHPVQHVSSFGKV